MSSPIQYDIPALYMQGYGRQDEPTDTMDHSKKAQNHLPKKGHVFGKIGTLTMTTTTPTTTPTTTTPTTPTTTPLPAPPPRVPPRALRGARWTALRWTARSSRPWARRRGGG